MTNKLPAENAASNPSTDLLPRVLQLEQAGRRFLENCLCDAPRQMKERERFKNVLKATAASNPERAPEEKSNV